MKIKFFKHSLGKDEINAIRKVVHSDFLSSGPYCRKFEKLFSKKFSKKYCATFSSWTMANYILIKSLKLKKDDEIILSPLTFVSSINTIILAGAKPIFVDVDLETGLIDPEKIRQKITKKTKAILVVHLYGQMCDMKEIAKICKAKAIKIIEDCAHCIEGNRNKILPGELSYAAIFSFYATKNITCGEGGAIITNNSRLDKKLKQMRYHGINKLINRKLIYNHWDQQEISLKCNMTDLNASILIPQIKKIEKNWKKRKLLWNKLIEFFKKYKDIRILKNIEDTKHAMHLFTFLVNPNIRDKLINNLIKNNVNCAVHYRPITKLSYYKKIVNEKKIPNATLIGKSTISLPFYPKLKKSELKFMLGKLKKSFSTFRIN